MENRRSPASDWKLCTYRRITSYQLLGIRAYLTNHSGNFGNLYKIIQEQITKKHSDNYLNAFLSGLTSFFWASCRIRTNDPEITNHVLWPTELKRRGGKLSISRRYNQLPLLRSSPGGFEGSWPYRTYPFCGCKGRHFYWFCNRCKKLFSPANN